jgi:thiol-disulfide isomerase/thioredoxin
LKVILLACALLLSSPLHAEEGVLKSFARGSIRTLIDARAGRPFILAFWSVDCVHCRDELAQLAALSQAHPGLEVVLVSTDSPAAAQEIEGVLRQYPLASCERWVFADAFTERLRFEIDPRWQGELPRTYLHGPGPAVQGITGRLSTAQIERWLQSTQREERHARD